MSKQPKDPSIGRRDFIKKGAAGAVVGAGAAAWSGLGTRKRRPRLLDGIGRRMSLLLGRGPQGFLRPFARAMAEHP